MSTIADQITDAIGKYETSGDFKRDAIEHVAHDAEPDDLPLELLGRLIGSYVKRHFIDLVDDALSDLVDEPVDHETAVQCAAVYRRSDDYETKLDDIADEVRDAD